MATLLRRRDEHDETNNVSADVEANDNGDKFIPPDSTLEEPGSKIWGPYLSLADRYDKDLVHNWRDDMDSLLIFAALFSASVTAFVMESYKTLVQDSGVVTVDILLQISKQLANVTQLSSAVQPPFQPASTDIAINVFWFLSLGFSLACALAAVLVRQWARQYLRLPRSLSSTTEQARTRQFLLENMEWWKMELVVEAIPALLHISLILFFIGLLLFVHSISVTLAVYFLCFSAISGSAYAIITVAPSIFPGCPYKTPFSGIFSLFLRFGTPPVRATWKYTTIIFACVALVLSSTLSLIKMWVPSATIPEWRWAIDTSEPIRTPLNRLWSQMGEIDRPLWTISAASRRIGHHLMHIPPAVHVFTTSSWSSVISSFNRTSLSLSKSLTSRRQTFQNQATMRDAYALQWAMRFSKRDIDLFTILSSVPELVRTYESDPVMRLVLWKSGIMSQSLRLLRSSAISGWYVTREPVLVACLDSLVWITQCPTWRLDEDGAWLAMETSLMEELISSITDATMYVRMAGDVGELFYGVLVNLFLQRIYHLETWIRTLDVESFHQKLHPWRSSVDRLRQLSRRCLVSQRIWRGPQDDNFYKAIYVLDIVFEATSSSQRAVCDSLGEFREACAAQLLKTPFNTSGSPPPFHATILSNRCDVATHLQRAPLSTLESQDRIFTLLDGLCKKVADKPTIETLTHSKQNTLLSAYTLVLFGHVDTTPQRKLRRFLHLDFLFYVHVYPSGGIPFDNSGQTVEIPFSSFCAILNDVASSLVTLELHSTTTAPEEYMIRYNDIRANAIRAFIGSRLRSVNEYHAVPLLIDAQHLRAARHFRANGWDWMDIINRTTSALGYASQLEESYNIDMHAELQYYEHDLWTCELQSGIFDAS